MKWMMEELVQSLHEIGDLVLVLANKNPIPLLREERTERKDLWTLDEQIGLEEID